jgi:hypothetical protein
MLSDFEVAFLDQHVAVPAVNRWIKLYAPLAFWHVATAFGLFGDAFCFLRNPGGTSDQDDIAALVGMEASSRMRGSSMLDLPRQAHGCQNDVCFGIPWHSS